MAMQHLNVPPDNHVKVLDGQGWVGLIDHLGSETTIVNAARVSFGKLKTEMNDLVVHVRTVHGSLCMQQSRHKQQNCQ